MLSKLARGWLARATALPAALIAVACSSPQAVLSNRPPTSVVLAPQTPTAGPAETTATTPVTTPATMAPAMTSAAAPTTTGAAAEPFAVTVSPVTAADLGASWRPGCPVVPEDLRLVRLSYWGFDGTAHTGGLVVHRDVTEDIVAVFRRLYDERFPIRRMQPIDAFAGDDAASMAADNTSAFNCRNAVAPGPPRWSVHAFGKAIDVNPVENPYLEGGEVQPPEGTAYVDRAQYRPGMAVDGGQLTAAFAAVGWYWGGSWAGTPDYQHFSATGG